MSRNLRKSISKIRENAEESNNLQASEIRFTSLKTMCSSTGKPVFLLYIYLSTNLGQRESLDTRPTMILIVIKMDEDGYIFNVAG